jgi:hypothetical protein
MLSPTIKPIILSVIMLKGIMLSIIMMRMLVSLWSPKKFYKIGCCILLIDKSEKSPGGATVREKSELVLQETQ